MERAEGISMGLFETKVELEKLSHLFSEYKKPIMSNELSTV
jgi:hypothetical protein